MLRSLLICGIVAGVLGGLLATGLAHFVGEPAVNQAIAFEESQAGHAGGSEPALVSRDIQRSVGLLTASVVYGIAVGGIFALVFAGVYGRVGRASPAVTALVLAAAAFVVVFLVPFIKYPSNPPAVGDPETIRTRTSLYFAMVGISLCAAVAAVQLRGRLLARWSSGVATLIGLALYFVAVSLVGWLFPGIHEVPEGFPADTLWRFREATIGIQLVMWATIGLVFAAAARRVMKRSPVPSKPRAMRVMSGGK